MGHLGQEGWQEAVPTDGGVLVRLGADPSGHLKSILRPCSSLSSACQARDLQPQPKTLSLHSTPGSRLCVKSQVISLSGSPLSSPRTVFD